MIRELPAKLSISDVEVGTVVQLKGGAPDMTVATISDGILTCQWIDTRETLRTAEFDIEMLAPGKAVARTVFVMPAARDKNSYVPADIRWAREQAELRGESE